MRLQIGTRNLPDVIQQIARWFPARAQQLAKLEAKCVLGLEVTLAPIRPRRSIDANARYWVIVSALAQYVGMTKAEMHTECLSEYHGFDLVEFRGSIRKKPRGRSHNLSRDDFAELMAIAERWAAEMGVVWDIAA